MGWRQTQRWARSGLASDNKRGGSPLGATNPVTRRPCHLQKLEALLKDRALGWLPIRCIRYQEEGIGGILVGLPPRALCWLPRCAALFGRRRHYHRRPLDGSPYSRSYKSSGKVADFHMSREMGAGVSVFNFPATWISGGSYMSPPDNFVTQTTRLPDSRTS